VFGTLGVLRLRRVHWTAAVCFTMKPVGKPDAGNRHVRSRLEALERGRFGSIRRIARDFRVGVGTVLRVTGEVRLPLTGSGFPNGRAGAWSDFAKRIHRSARAALSSCSRINIVSMRSNLRSR
jgi:hypothetical protein